MTAFWLTEVVPPDSPAVTAFGYEREFTQTPELNSVSGRIGGTWGPRETPFFRMDGAELAPGMSGGPVLHSASGRVCALVKMARERNTDRGGLITPASGIWALGAAGAKLWRDHDRFHASSQVWQERRRSLGSIGVLQPDEEADLFALLAAFSEAGDEASTASISDPEGPVRRQAVTLMQAPVHEGRLHPLIELTLDLADQALAGDWERQLSGWTAGVAGRLGQREFVSRSRPSRPTKRSPRSWRSPERRALLIGAQSHLESPSSGSVEALAEALKDADTGYFGQVEDAYPPTLDRAQKSILEFFAAGVPSDVLLLYLGGRMMQEERVGLFLDPTIAGLEAAPAGDTTLSKLGISIAAVAQAAGRINKDTRLVVLLDYHCGGQADPRAIRVTLQQAWPRLPNVDVIGMMRRPGKPALAEVIRKLLQGDHDRALYEDDVMAENLTTWVSGLEDRSPLVLNHFEGPRVTLARRPLSPDDRYMRDVLANAKKASDVTTDPWQRYRLTDVSDRHRIREDVNETVALWRKLRRGIAYRDVARELLFEHEKTYKKIFDSAAAGDRSSLQELLDQRHWKRRESDRTDDEYQVKLLVQRLQAKAGPWRMITPDDVTFLAADSSQEVVERATRRANIDVVQPVRLPVVPLAPGLEAVHRWMQTQGLRHLLDLAYGGLTEIATGLLTGVRHTVRTADGFLLDGASLQRAVEQKSMPREVLATLQTLADLDPGALYNMFLGEIAEAAREQVGSDADVLLDTCRGFGLGDADARALGHAISRESSPSKAIQHLIEMIRSNRVFAAAKELQGWSVTERPFNSEVLLDVLGRRQRRARGLLAEALREQDSDRGWTILMEAESTAADLPDLQQERSRFPPTVVEWVNTTAGPTAVQVRWGAPPSPVGEFRYRVFRHEGSQPPLASRMGLEMASEISGTGYVDVKPPINVPLWYSVQTTRGGIPSSTVLSDRSVMHLPIVQDLAAEPGDGEITLKWKILDAATTVKVQRLTSGSGPQEIPSQRDGTTDRGLVNGLSYRYRVTTVYTSAFGEAMLSEVLDSDPVTPHAPLPVLPMANPRPAPGNPGLLVVEGVPSTPHDVRIIVAPDPLPYQPGDLVSVADLERAGSLRTLPVPASAPPMTAAPATDSYCALVAVAGDRARLGHIGWWGPVPAVEGLDCVRRGSQLEIFWNQTRDRDDLYFTVELMTGEEKVLATDFFPGQYVTGWPVTAPADQGPMRLVVTPYRHRGGHEQRCYGRPEELDVPARTEVRYSISAKSRGATSQIAEVVIEATRATHIETLEIAALLGDIHPLSTSGGTTRGKDPLFVTTVEDLHLGPGVPMTISVGPFTGQRRIRCFTSSPNVELLHPPVSERTVGRS